MSHHHYEDVIDPKTGKTYEQTKKSQIIMTEEEQAINSEPTFRSELTSLINKYSLENTSNTPDYILADFLMSCLEAFDDATYARNQWYSADSKDDVGLVNTKKE